MKTKRLGGAFCVAAVAYGGGSAREAPEREPGRRTLRELLLSRRETAGSGLLLGAEACAARLPPHDTAAEPNWAETQPGWRE